MDKSAEKKRKIISQYKKIFSSTDGRAVLHDLMVSNFLTGASPHVIGDSDWTFKNIGKQELVGDILRMMKIDPEKYLAIREEQEGEHDAF